MSIRISSPGNDGSVTQANIAAALGVATGTSTVAAVVHASIPPAVNTAPTVSLPFPVADAGISLVTGLPSLPELVAPTSAAPVFDDVTGSILDAGSISISDLVELPLAMPPFPGTARSGPVGLGVASLPRLAVPGSTTWLAPATLPAVGPDEHGSRAGVAGVSSSERAASPRDRGKPKPAPRWKAPVPADPLPASVSSGTSAAPASGGGSSGGGIPIFLALPFLAVMLDLARRVALDRASLPSGHRSRMPENPG